MELIAKMFMAKAKKVFFNPSPLYNYDSIAQGCVVKDEYGDEWTMSAIDRSIWRGFHRVNNNEDGPKKVYIQYFIENKVKITDTLKKINSKDELNELSNYLYYELNDLLKENIKDDKLVYNRVRVPIDLFLEHVVSMAIELNDCRKKLIPFLFVPLDEHTIRNCFNEKQLIKDNLNIISRIGDIDLDKEYDRMQKILYNRAVRISKEYGQEYYRIYSELLWHNRYRNFGRNLFETNLLKNI
ncbi:hypothetical protein Ccar_24240 [Clostridium carboxidivorans P7]|uniref:Putative cytoplasmic protein n=1 Tax=Clostridium carboxidivorans P7 TaxID=536227 RepID=C6Q105_9CLOT|nr:hypothetical protein [Clostridium carboxidivorans]AKN33765.1 hypothetical protein Ccar_24240 [Clostridium carboxidivorans P7]EET84824.1 putative cytoplasmic protein [Clostridium carboxidivorans P7]EFG86629.1 hypothetical protein CLCAR_3579 [Clostridium carboxidivorans P7]